MIVVIKLLTSCLFSFVLYLSVGYSVPAKWLSSWPRIHARHTFNPIGSQEECLNTFWGSP